MLTSRRFLVCLSMLAVASGACSHAREEGEVAEGSDSQLTRNEITYRFETKATLAVENGALVIGPSKEGAVILAPSTGGAHRTRTLVWNGAALEDRGESGPFYATGSMAYDPASGTTWFLQQSSSSTSRYESLYRWQNGAWEQRYSRAAEARYSQLYFDTKTAKLMRVTDHGIDTYGEDGSSASNRRFSTTDPQALDRAAIAYDAARGALVVFADPIRERRPGASYWSAPVWTSVAAPRVVPPDVYLGYCDDGLFDGARSIALQFCSSYGRDGFAFEWDGSKLVFTRTQADPSQGIVPAQRTYDVEHQTLVGVGWNQLPERGIALQTATREHIVRANQLPKLQEASKHFEIYATEESKLSLSTIDDDRDPVTVELLDAPAGSTFDGQTLTWTPALAEQGPHLLHLRLSDGEASVATQASVEVKSVSYPELPGEVAVDQDFWMNGEASLRGFTRGAQAQVTCKIAGKNPGAVRARCSVTTEVCTGGAYPSAGACATTGMYALAIEGVLAPNGTLSQSTREDRSCADKSPSDPGWCPRWSGSVTMRLDKDQHVCVGYEYERDTWAHGYFGQARSTGSSCTP